MGGFFRVGLGVYSKYIYIRILRGDVEFLRFFWVIEIRFKSSRSYKNRVNVVRLSLIRVGGELFYIGRRRRRRFNSGMCDRDGGIYGC